MSTTTSDIDLKSKIAKAFEAHPEHQNPDRKNALAGFLKMGLPTNKSEEYRFTPVARLLEKNFDFDKVSPAESNLTSIDSFLIPGLEANVLVFVNGRYSKSLSTIVSSEKEIQITPLSASDAKTLTTSTDSFVLLNSALWHDGLSIRVPANTNVELPVFILHVSDASSNQSVNHTRLQVTVENDSSLTLIERSASIGENPIFHTFVEEIKIAEKASLDYIKIQNDEGKLHQVATSLIRQADNSILNTFTLTLSGTLIRNNFNIAVDGENCESHFYGLYLLNGNTIADNHTVVDHLKPNSHSNELYKGVMDESAKGVFNGKIFVRPHAQLTNAFQSNRNILLTDTATINTKPQLEIWADDVKCSHGCTTGQLDEEALFYLQSRGIPMGEAKAMLLYAFAMETLTPIKNETIKNYLDTLISKRLNRLDATK